MNADLLAGLQPAPDQPIAVVVFHGIGQQAPFETLNTVVNGFLDAHLESGDGWTVQQVRLPESNHAAEVGEIEFISFDGKSSEMLPLAAIKLRNGDGVEQEFHFFEVYWATLTEGVTGFVEVLLFLLKAAWDGVNAHLKGRSFVRFTFGTAQNYGILAMTGAQLLLAGLLVSGLVILSAAFFGVLALDIAGHFRFNAAVHFPLEPVRRELVSFVFSLPVLLLLPVINALLQRWSKTATAPAAPVINFVALLPLLAGVSGFGISVVYSLVTFGDGFFTWWSDSWFELIPAALRWVIFAFAGTWLYVQFHLFMVKYLGDVTAYVSAHAVNRFWKVRDQIQYRAMGICRSVYLRGTEENPYYKNIVLIGHSLGSVIAYDILNALINLEIHQGMEHLKDTAARTRLLLTCGSPLNKIAYLFRFQTGTGPIPHWRELLNNFRQPLIVSHDAVHRPCRWINISCFPDWISGKLRYFEPPLYPRQLASRRDAFRDRVINECVDPDGIVPLAAHSQYFAHKEFRRAVYDALWKSY